MTNLERFKQDMTAEKFAEWLRRGVECDWCPADDYCTNAEYKDCGVALKEWAEGEA